MNNISIKGVCECSNLDRNINLSNGAIVVQKENNDVIGVYLVIGNATSGYCTLINLDNGQIAFEERCSRATTERRVLRHLTRAGFSIPYDPDSHDQDYKFQNMRIQVYINGNYKVNLEFGEEQIIGGVR